MNVTKEQKEFFDKDQLEIQNKIKELEFKRDNPEIGKEFAAQTPEEQFKVFTNYRRYIKDVSFSVICHTLLKFGMASRNVCGRIILKN